MEEYLSVDELSKRIKIAPGTIRNMVWQKVFVQGRHYLKPTPRKLLFVWSAVESWLWGGKARKEARGVTPGRSREKARGGRLNSPSCSRINI